MPMVKVKYNSKEEYDFGDGYLTNFNYLSSDNRQTAIEAMEEGLCEEDEGEFEYFVKE